MDKQNYEIVRSDSFFKVNASIVENEIDLSSTVTMINLIDLTKIEEIRSSSVGPKPSYTVFVAKALAKSLVDFPEMNKRFYKPYGLFPRVFQEFKNVDMGIASEVTDPKLAHVAYIGIMKDVQSKSLQEIQQWLLDFRKTEAVAQWKIFSGIILKLPLFLSKIIIRLPVYFPSLWAKYRGGVAIISSPAKYGVDGLVAAWSAPIGVSFGYVKDRVVSKNGQIVAVPSFNLTVNFDRRIFSGAQAARFIARISEVLEKAEFNI